MAPHILTSLHSYPVTFGYEISEFSNTKLGVGNLNKKKYFPNMKLLFSENQYETENVKSMSIEENCLKKAYI